MELLKQDFKNLWYKLRFWFRRITKSKSIKPDFSSNKKEYDLVFEDNFETLDKNVWSYHPRWGTYHPQNIKGHNKAPLAYWDPKGSGLEIKDGKLHLKSFRSDTEVHFIDSDGKDYGKWTIPYTCGYVCTDNSFNTLHGYFEISCKIPKGIGYWPAFWFASNADWPPEIDMFEFWTDKKWHDVFHVKQRKMKAGIYAGSNAKPLKPKKSLMGVSPFALRSGYTTLPKNITETFNKYALEWDETGMKYYFNDNLVYHQTADLARHETLHKHDMHIILNHAVSGGTPLHKLEKVMDDFVIDYVKVYKKKLTQ